MMTPEQYAIMRVRQQIKLTTIRCKTLEDMLPVPIANATMPEHKAYRMLRHAKEILAELETAMVSLQREYDGREATDQGPPNQPYAR